MRALTMVRRPRCLLPLPGGPNGHGVSATPENVSRFRHDRFPHPGPLPEGEGDSERAARDFHGNADSIPAGS
jgi:hypothetical protein